MPTPQPGGVTQFLEVHRALPVPNGETTPVVARGTRYGGQMVENVVPTKHVLADEGTYFVAVNPIPGTKIDYGSGGTQSSFSDTVPFMVLQNTDTLGNPLAKRVFLDYIKLTQIGGTAPASTTSIQLAMKIDSALRTPTSGSLTNIKPSCVNMDMPSNPVGLLLVPAGAVATIPAASNAARLVGRDQLKGGPTLILDEHNLTFGQSDTPAGQGYLTTVASYWNRYAPITLGPQQSLVIHLWFPSGITNPFSFEFEAGWWER